MRLEAVQVLKGMRTGNWKVRVAMHASLGNQYAEIRVRHCIERATPRPRKTGKVFGLDSRGDLGNAFVFPMSAAFWTVTKLVPTGPVAWTQKMPLRSVVMPFRALYSGFAARRKNLGENDLVLCRSD